MLGPGPVRLTQTVTGQSTTLAADATGPGTSPAQFSAKTNRSTVTSAAPPTDTRDHFRSKRMEDSPTKSDAQMIMDVSRDFTN
jgi:hypothetical protein